MQHGFWKQLRQPFSVLAPMSGYTDMAYREMIARFGKPDVMFTEFVPADGLDSDGRENLAHYLWKSPRQHPIVAQLYGGDPDRFEESARYVASLGFDGIDLNMGCPARKVERRLGGSALINDPLRALEIIAAAKAGAGEVPVSVKTRMGYRADELESWLTTLVSAGPAAITLHARRRIDRYGTKARWEAIGRAQELLAEIEPNAERRPLLIGNGDVFSVADLASRAADSGCAGVMVGRGIIGNPWFFAPQADKRELTLGQVLEVVLEHFELYCSHYGPETRLERMRKHLKAYITGYPGITLLRRRMMRVTQLAELREVIQEALSGADAGKLLPRYLSDRRISGSFGEGC